MEYNVIIPEPIHKVIEFTQENKPGIGVINKALCNFHPKIVFAWHLSIMVEFEELAENGMPTVSQRELCEEWENFIDQQLIIDKTKPNAIFLARLTWNGTREVIYRVHNPDLANLLLKNPKNILPLPLDFRIDHDSNWNLTDWHLDNYQF